MSKQIKVAINGFGRIGRAVLRALYETPRPIQITTINEPSNLEAIAYLAKYDSTHGVFHHKVDTTSTQLQIDDDVIDIYHEQDIANLDWKKLDIDILLECSGQYALRPQLEHICNAGCPRILLSNPGKSAEDVDNTIVYGINENTLNNQQNIVSAASCTTNAIVPVMDLLHKNLGVANAYMTTLHSAMNDQPIIDGYHHADLWRTRSAIQSMVPVATGLAHGVERLIPDLTGLINAKSIRVPVLNVSAIDLTVNLQQNTTVADLQNLFLHASKAQDFLFSCINHAYASIDFNHDSHSSIIDLSQIRVNQGKSINLIVWFDNEWGFANRMLDVAQHWASIFNS